MVRMDKKGKWYLWILGIVVAFGLVGLGFVLYLVFGDFGKSAEALEIKRQVLTNNPVASLTDIEAIEQFNESFVSYLLYSIDADDLHQVPLSNEAPEVELVIGEGVYHAVVDEGIIKVEEGESEEADIIITTSREEAVEMIRDSDSIVESFDNGQSQVEVVAGNTELLSKGYLGFYQDLFEREAEVGE